MQRHSLKSKKSKSKFSNFKPIIKTKHFADEFNVYDQQNEIAHLQKSFNKSGIDLNQIELNENVSDDDRAVDKHPAAFA